MRCVVVACVVAMVAAGCAAPEDPARVELRARLQQQTRLTSEELGRLVAEVAKSIGDKRVQIAQDGVTSDLDAGQREVVLGMFTNPVGMFDEGLQNAAGRTVRVLNAPGVSEHREYVAMRRIMVDVETFLPRRFEFSYEFPGMGDYAFDLRISP